MNNPYLPNSAPITKITKETDIDYTFRLACDIKPQNGQFLQISIPRVGEAPISISDFGDGYLDMTIRRVGRVTNDIHELKVGDRLFIRGPYGNGFPIDKYKDKNLIIAAGGTGLAPVKSIVNYFYNNIDELKSFKLLVGFKSPKDILFSDEIEKWKEKIDVTLTVDNGDENWTGNKGLITKYVSQLNIDDMDNTEIIIVGPPIMMKFTGLEFLKLDVPKEKIWVSFERKMSCGIGKCGHCKIDETYVCLEGPVFNYTKAKKLID